ncbi:MAG: squalene/phytoene synthase family protein [Paracoccaceae bacterium]|nr:squalene/phytoene synthase family protein [Paracoccaceae bacterium]
MSTNEDLSPERSLAKNGKSFYWAGRFLDAGVGHNAAQLYSFCRVLDDMADGDIANGPERLLNIRLGLAGKASAEDPIFTDLTAFMAYKDISSEVIVALIDGLLEDQQEVALPNKRALLRYAYRVAGTVGLMMCRVLDCNDPAATAHAIDLGIAMQLTNIARDVEEDARMGRRYLPGTWVDDLAPAAILTAAQDTDDAQRRVVSEAVERLLMLAEAYYASGTSGLAYLPVRAHLAISIAARVYRQIGVQLSTKGCRWYAGREFTSKSVKAICTLQALGTLPRRLHALPTHDPQLHIALEGLPDVV